MNIAIKAKNIYRDKFVLSRSILVVGSSLIGNAFAYLFQVITGRHLSIEDYSSLVALFSLATIIPLFITIFVNAVPKVVAEIKFDKYPRVLSDFFFSLSITSLVLVTSLVVVLLILTDKIAYYTKIENTELIRLYIISMGLSVFGAHIPSTLAGLLRFKAFSFITIFSYSGRFIVALAVSLIGLGLVDIYYGLILISILVITASFLLIRKNIQGPFKFKWENLILLAKYSTGGALALIGISFLQNNDIILVKHLFNPTLSGIFGSTSIVGRIIFFAASPVAIVMLPICAEKFKKGEDYIKPFIGTFALTIFIAGTITCLYWVMPELFTKTFFGEKYLPGAAYLPLYATFMMVFAVMNFVALFFIAVSEFKLASFTIIAAAIQYVSIEFIAKSLHQVIWSSIMAVFAAFGCLAVFMGYRKLTKGKFLISKAVVK